MPAGRPKKTSGPRIKGGSESARLAGKIGTVLYFSPEEREEILAALPLAGTDSLTEYGRKAMLTLARRLNRKNSRNA